MKRVLLPLLVLFIFSLNSLVAQNDYEKFIKEMKNQKSEFIKDREAAFKEFKSRYEEAFNEYKRLYEAQAKEDIGFIEMMASDDGRPITKLPSNVSTPKIVSTASAQKKVIQENVKRLSTMKPEDVLSNFSDGADSLENMQNAAIVMETLVSSMKGETPVAASKDNLCEVVLETPAERKDIVKLQQAQYDVQERVVTEEEQPGKQEKQSAEGESSVKDEKPAKKDAAKKDDGKKDSAKKDVGKKDDAKKDAVKKDDGKKDDAKKDAVKKDDGKKDENIKPVSIVPSGKPTSYKRISSPFGTRVHPITKRTHTHKGVDLAAAAMTPIYATADGVVTIARFYGGYGNFVKINHDNGYKTGYAHMKQIAVTQNKAVKKGDLIGYVGSTGRSTGNHLHYEVYFKDNLIDPVTTF